VRASLLFCVASLGWGLVAPLAAQSAPYTGPIIDVHLHSRTTEGLKKFRHGLAKPGAEQSELISDRAASGHDAVVAARLGVAHLRQLPELDADAHFRATLAAMDRFNIVLGAVSGSYERSLAWAKAAPGRFLVGENSGNVERAKLARATGPVDFIGEWGAQYAGIAPNDPVLEPMWAWAEAEDLPVGYHMHPGPPGAPYVGTKLKTAHGRPLLLEEVLQKHPKLRLYVMHAGWPFCDEMIALMWDYPQVYVDVAVINWSLSRAEFHAYLKRLVDAGFIDRIMFGSDQMDWPEAIGKAIEAVDSAPFLNAEQKYAIFYGNAARFFRIGKPDRRSPGESPAAAGGKSSR
jgi:predicted TIM-barrel fold metal-dependent hydrolase